MGNYRLLISHHGLFYAMSEHDTYADARAALPRDLPASGSFWDSYGMEIVRTADWKVVDRGWSSWKWGWVLRGTEEVLEDF